MGSILLVESDPDTRDRLGSAMRDAGHEILFAVSTREAILRISEGGIDAVVIDSYDPRVGMTELSKSMNALPDAPPLVLVSSSPHAPEISARIGAAAFLPKPVEPADLVHAVGRIVGDIRPVRIVEDFSDESPTGPARQLG